MKNIKLNSDTMIYFVNCKIYVKLPVNELKMSFEAGVSIQCFSRFPP